MKKLLLTILLLLPNLALANDKAIRDEINAKVSQVVELLRDSYAQEYEKARGVQILKAAKDDTVVAVAIFTIEGFAQGNNYSQFMAVFANLSEAPEVPSTRLSLLDVMEVGRKGIRSIESNKIIIEKSKGGLLITLPALEYGPNDAMCCPSIKSKVRFAIVPAVGGRLKEIKN